MDTVSLLREGCARERTQARFYRGLSGQAESAGDASAAERLNALLADEQHHVSRLTARLLELGETPSSGDGHAPACGLDEWEEVARAREEDEISWYESALESVDDLHTASVLREILDSERNHQQTLAGKWMSAAVTPPEESGE